jgi:RNA polymerase sigma-70 factor (ECF subfamily)
VPGERPATDEVVERHAEAVTRFVALSGVPAAERDDVVQDTWVRMLRADSLPAADADQGRYLRSISRNLIRDRWRRRQRAEAASGRKEPAPETGPADESLIREERGALVRSAFERLDSRQRQVLLLRIVEGRPTDEVAAAIGVDTATVRMIQFRALAALRRSLLADAPGYFDVPKGGDR